MKIGKTDLLNKLNAKGAHKNRSIRWQFQDKENPAHHGFAQIRFEHSERFLIAEAIHWGKKPDLIEEEQFELQDSPDFYAYNKPQSFELKAHRSWINDEYEILSIHIDGEEYDVNDDAMVELAFAVFLSRIDAIESFSTNETLKRYESNFATQPVIGSTQKSTNIHKNMPTIFFGDHLLAFSSKVDIQGVA